MILEIRRYTLHPGKREEFIRFFEAVNRPALKAAGMLVFGPMRDTEDPDKVHWIRAFQNMEERERIKEAFYGSPVWAEEVEPTVMPLIAHFEASVVSTTEGFEGFKGTPEL
ncbi:NIPSNAP family protein [Leisingera sp. JC11]|uniref:NIPSNAP family protein n=1 Tax=Leisingera sp. JC11 TaxID=3042469 RepID=UPI003454B3CB